MKAELNQLREYILMFRNEGKISKHEERACLNKLNGIEAYAKRSNWVSAPSDEELDMAAIDYCKEAFKDEDKDDHQSEVEAFDAGAIWMREQLERSNSVSVEDVFIEGYKQRALSGNKTFDEISKQYAKALFEKWQSELPEPPKQEGQPFDFRCVQNSSTTGRCKCLKEEDCKWSDDNQKQ